MDPATALSLAEPHLAARMLVWLGTDHDTGCQWRTLINVDERGTHRRERDTFLNSVGPRGPSFAAPIRCSGSPRRRLRATRSPRATVATSAWGQARPFQKTAITTHRGRGRQRAAQPSLSPPAIAAHAHTRRRRTQVNTWNSDHAHTAARRQNHLAEPQRGAPGHTRD